MDVVNVDLLLHLFSWANPVKSATYLVAVNIFCWFLQRQRPVFVVSAFVLVFYLLSLWKRIRHEILVDPPDREDWTNIAYDDMERTVIESVKSTWRTWKNMRKNNYYMWIILTSLFWIALAKIGSLVSFVTILFLLSNGGFIAGPLFKTFPVELLGPTTGGDDDYSEDVSRITTATDQTDNNASLIAEQFLTPSSWGRIIQDTLLKTFDSAIRSSPSHSNTEPSTSLTPEPESSSSLNAQTTSTNNQDSDSSDEFLFDAKHFENSSSSTSSKSNSFELIHF